ncbi:uncharacterized protein LOC123694679 isoform X2 [Colias croceus]|uniref:uncharacterized protein LOC123694679 isoform X2 n=1 Tax=Colias crocea TaxID=72248 RepID=UPI001E27BA0C|nr:uncharacterized protein LOC123694679 isoform X2 [Colias croceus]
MSQLKLNREETLKLVELYKINDCLWNIKNKDYRNKEARINALQNIVDEMQLTGFNIKDVQAKIKCLRSTYYLELDKIEKSERLNDEEHVYVPKIEWFNEMHSFIYDVTLKRKDFEKPSPSTQKKNRKKNTATPIKIEKEKDSSAIIKEEDDEFDSFGKMAAKSLRKLSHYQQSIALKLMSDVLYHAKMERLNETSTVICKVPRKVVSIVADASISGTLPSPNG